MELVNGSNLDTLEDVANFESYTYLEGNGDLRKEQKRQFIAGEVDNPTLDYPQLNDETKEELERKILELEQFIERLSPIAEEKAAIKDAEAEMIELYAHILKAQEKLAELKMLIATCNDNSEVFAQQSVEVFGEPQVKTFRMIVRQLNEQIANLTNATEEQKLALERLKASFPELFRQVATTETASNDDVLFDMVVQSIDPRIAQYLDNINVVDRSNVQLDEFVLICRDALRLIEADGWEVEISNNATNISAHQEKKLLIIPHNHVPGPLKAALKLVSHEIGTHVLRRMNGSRQKLKLLGIGLDRYLPGEEAVATLRDLSFETDKKKRNFIGATSQYLTIALGFGVDGKKRDFRQTYEVMKDLRIALGQKDPEGQAYQYCVRAFRGTNCRTSGAVYTKDLAYLDGRINTAQALRDNPNLFKILNLGKFDPSNFRHILVLHSQGLIDENLAPRQA